MMKDLFTRLNVFTLLSVSILIMNAQDYHARHDSIYVYKSWEAIMEQWADTIIVNPEIEPYTQYDIAFYTNDKRTNRMLQNEAVALAVGDSIWYVNSFWLNENFSGDSGKMEDWAPLFFTEKIAFVQWGRYGPKFGLTLLGALLGDAELFNDSEPRPGDLYLIEFDNASVENIDYKLLTQLLEAYPDLQRRYLMMKDYKKPYMVQYFFLEYVNRLNDDPSVPYITD